METHEKQLTTQMLKFAHNMAVSSDRRLSPATRQRADQKVQQACDFFVMLYADRCVSAIRTMKQLESRNRRPLV